MTEGETSSSSGGEVAGTWYVVHSSLPGDLH